MKQVQTTQALRTQIAAWRRAGERIALVPTMGNLHEGHASLIAQARKLAPRVVVSLFVNPLQFGPNEDFARYPRTPEADAALLRAQAADLLFAPSVDDLYPAGFPPETTVQIGGALASILDARHRPGHFTGVATVVNILFNRVQPDLALFGEKDYQQLAVIRRMVADLGLPVEIVAAPTRRAADGLALSSRNQYLSAEERARAPALHAALQAVAAGLAAGRRDFDALCENVSSQLSAQAFQVQYFEILRPDLGSPQVSDSAFVILAAVFLGTTRLIDNLAVGTTGMG